MQVAWHAHAFKHPETQVQVAFICQFFGCSIITCENCGNLLLTHFFAQKSLKCSSCSRTIAVAPHPVAEHLTPGDMITAANIDYPPVDFMNWISNSENMFINTAVRLGVAMRCERDVKQVEEEDDLQDTPTSNANSNMVGGASDADTMRTKKKGKKLKWERVLLALSHTELRIFGASKTDIFGSATKKYKLIQTIKLDGAPPEISAINDSKKDMYMPGSYTLRITPAGSDKMTIIDVYTMQYMYWWAELLINSMARCAALREKRPVMASPLFRDSIAASEMEDPKDRTKKIKVEKAWTVVTPVVETEQGPKAAPGYTGKDATPAPPAAVDDAGHRPSHLFEAEASTAFTIATRDEEVDRSVKPVETLPPKRTVVKGSSDVLSEAPSSKYAIPASAKQTREPDALPGIKVRTAAKTVLQTPAPVVERPAPAPLAPPAPVNDPSKDTKAKRDRSSVFEIQVLQSLDTIASRMSLMQARQDAFEKTLKAMYDLCLRMTEEKPVPEKVSPPAAAPVGYPPLYNMMAPFGQPANTSATSLPRAPTLDDSASFAHWQYQQSMQQQWQFMQWQQQQQLFASFAAAGAAPHSSPHLPLFNDGSRPRTPSFVPHAAAFGSAHPAHFTPTMSPSISHNLHHKTSGSSSNQDSLEQHGEDTYYATHIRSPLPRAEESPAPFSPVTADVSSAASSVSTIPSVQPEREGAPQRLSMLLADARVAAAAIISADDNTRRASSPMVHSVHAARPGSGLGAVPPRSVIPRATSASTFNGIAHDPSPLSQKVVSASDTSAKPSDSSITTSTMTSDDDMTVEQSQAILNARQSSSRHASRRPSGLLKSPMMRKLSENLEVLNSEAGSVLSQSLPRDMVQREEMAASKETTIDGESKPSGDTPSTGDAKGAPSSDYMTSTLAQNALQEVIGPDRLSEVLHRLSSGNLFAPLSLESTIVVPAETPSAAPITTQPQETEAVSL